MKGNFNLINTYEMYAIVDSKNNILGTYRQKLTANNEMRRLQRDMFDDKLKVIVVPEKK